MNDNSNITDRELEFLIAVLNYTIAHDNQPPSNSWLCSEMGVSESGISNFKRSLKGKNYLIEITQQPILTDSAKELLSSLSVVFPTAIPIAGQVKAGRTRQDEMIVEISELRNLREGNFPTIKIPEVAKPLDTFALEVFGKSMESENIVQGDYIIVQSYDNNQKPGQGDLIVAQYLPIHNESFLMETIDRGRVPDEYLEGPTVKYYYQQEDHIRLSPRKNHANTENTIKTRYIQPIGKVIGVYRPT